MKKLEDIKTQLKAHNLRVTQGRLAVAKVLLDNPDQPLSSAEIFSKIEKSYKSHCDQVSVYRTLTTYLDLGIVSKQNFYGEAVRFQYIGKKQNSEAHQHFFKCIKCQIIEPFKNCLVLQIEKKLEAKGYRNLNHHLEIVGICPQC
jgi:Fur family ferric uptake transcriptional regulator